MKHYLEKLKPTDIERFLSYLHYEPNSGCILWGGSQTRGGYGQFGIEECPRRTHIISYFIHKGQIPDGLCVLHKCDTPACVNPDHLFLGTVGDNSRDMVAKGRHVPVSMPRAKNPNAKLTEEQMVEIENSCEATRVLAERFGVAQHTIRVYRSKKKRDRRDWYRANSKLSTDDVRTIISRLRGGESRKQLALEYSVGYGAISDIEHGRTWSDITGIRNK